MSRAVIQFLLFLTSVSAFAQSKPGDFKLGTWFGYWKINGQTEAIPLRLDNFLYQSDGVRDFPAMYALIKTTLGGYDTAEYGSSLYKRIQWDPAQYTLTFDEPGNDIFITGKVFSDPKLHFDGQATNRITQATGTVYLEFLDDEPDDSGQGPASPTFISELSGEYSGSCGSKTGMMQIASLRTPDSKNVIGLSNYQTVSRFALFQPDICPSDRGQSWCQWKNYSEASYDFTTNNVTFSGQFGADQCQLKANHLICTIDLNFDGKFKCDLIKKNVATKDFKQYSRKYVVGASSAQRVALPNWSPPLNKDLITALSGTFSGYLHNDTSDVYQPIQISAMAYNATENPHIENSVLISVKSYQYFGSQISSELFAQEYENRSAYFRPGYTLTSEHSDTMLQIKEWKVGYIEGTLYSKNFGRVGTFQLVKSATLPAINGAAKFVPSISGEYNGPIDNPNGVPFNLNWMQLLMPIRPQTVETNLVTFSGNTGFVYNGRPELRYGIRSGFYDFYSGRVAWNFGPDADNLYYLFGRTDVTNQLQLMYFSKPLAMGLIPSFGFNTYKKKIP